MAEVGLTALTAAFSAGTFLVAGASVLTLFRLAGTGGIRIRPVAGFKVRTYGDISDALQKFAARAGKEYGRVFSVGKTPYLIFLCFLALVGFYAGIAYLKNLPAAALLACICVVLPEQVRAGRRRFHREKVIEQLGASVRVFAAEYSDTPHPVKALAAASGKLPDPIGTVMRRAVRDLSSSRNFDEIDAALLRLGKELGNEYGRLFVQLLRISFEDEAVKPLFARLAARITSQQDLIRKNRLGINMDRMLAAGLNLAIVPAYFFVIKVVPEAREFFTSTMAGKGLVALCLLSVAAGSLMDIILGGGGDIE